jgi:DNA-binding HxlR family transcriptional regulator
MKKTDDERVQGAHAVSAHEVSRPRVALQVTAETPRGKTKRKSACAGTTAGTTAYGNGVTDDTLDGPAGEDQADLEVFLCPVDEAARIVGQKWTLQIVHHLLDGRSRRFCELQDALGKVNPSTLSSRLKMLEEAGLVNRSQISDIPPHVEYRLTAMGAELSGVISEITRWSNHYLCTPHKQSAPDDRDTNERDSDDHDDDRNAIALDRRERALGVVQEA